MNMNNPFPSPDPKSKSPIIRIGEDRDLLRKKLEEYRRRLKGPMIPTSAYRPPEALLDFDTIYKIAVAEELVDTGEVNTYNLSHKLNQQYGRFDVTLFNNACGVIEDYIQTGGKKVRGGTGLPKKEEEPEV